METNGLAPPTFNPPWKSPEPPSFAAPEAPVVPPAPSVPVGAFLPPVVEPTATPAFIPTAADIADVDVDDEPVSVSMQIPAVETQFIGKQRRGRPAKLETVQPSDIEKVNATTVIAESPTTTTFEIEDVPVVLKERKPKPTVYPFDSLEVGQSFFIAGKVVKDMATTVSSANKRYAIPDPAGGVKISRGKEVPNTVQIRKFALIADVKNGVEGIRIGRVL